MTPLHLFFKTVINHHNVISLHDRLHLLSKGTSSVIKHSEMLMVLSGEVHSSCLKRCFFKDNL